MGFYPADGSCEVGEDGGKQRSYQPQKQDHLFPERSCAALHFVRFPDAQGSTYWSAARTFGLPDFLHRHWDKRAFREIADGDLVVFAKGDADQAVVPFNGDDEFYALRCSGVAS